MDWFSYVYMSAQVRHCDASYVVKEWTILFQTFVQHPWNVKANFDTVYKHGQYHLQFLGSGR